MTQEQYEWRDTEKKKEPVSNRHFAKQCLLLTIGFAAVAFLAEVKLSRKSHVWPITANYFLPNLCMLLAWMFMLFFLIAVLVWVIGGDEK